MTVAWYRVLNFVTLLLSFLTLSSSSPMVGGFNEIEKPEENPMLRGVTQYVQTQLPLQSRRYSFDYDDSSSEGNLRVVKAFQQVVAGMNYRILYAVEDNQGKLTGAFKVQVYDRFGDVSVTAWDEEMSVSEASNILAGQATVSPTDFST